MLERFKGIFARSNISRVKAIKEFGTKGVCDSVLCRSVGARVTVPGACMNIPEVTNLDLRVA